jgi:hypothetical protein
MPQIRELPLVYTTRLVYSNSLLMHSRDPTEAQSGMDSGGLPPGVDIDIEVCGHCGGSVKVIPCIEDQTVIDRILAHLREKEQGRPTLSHLVPLLSRAHPGPLTLFAGRESTAPNQQGRY